MPTEIKSLEKSAKGSGREAAGMKAAHSGPTSGSLLTTAGNLAIQRVSAPRLQRKARINRSSDLYEEEADRVSQQVLHFISVPTVQRKCACGGEGECDECKRKAAPHRAAVSRKTEDLAVQRFPLGEDTPGAGDAAGTAARPSANPDPAAAPSSPGWIVEDNVTDLGAGQMKKSEFLGQLRAPVTAAVQSGMQGSKSSVLGDIAIEPWFRSYASQSAQQLERTIHQSVPGSGGVTDAGAYIPMVCAQVESSVAEWARTGKMPPGAPGLPGIVNTVSNAVSNAVSSVGDALSNAASAVTNTASDVAQGVSNAVSSVGSGLSDLAQGAGNTLSNIGAALFKAKDGGPHQPDDPRSIQSQLGAGESLDGTLQSRMSSAFGYDFSSVRVHKDNRAAQLSSDLNARAFTVGRNVAFGAGEYQPGNPIGDALIAHELAHVVQQGGATAQAPLQKGESETGPLEDDADFSAVQAVASLWNGAGSGLANIDRKAVPALKSGLKLQRCSGKLTSGKKPAEAQYYDEPDGSFQGVLHWAGLRPTKADRVQEARNFFAASPGLMMNGELVDADSLSDDEVLEQFRQYKETCLQMTGGGQVPCEKMTPSVAGVIPSAPASWPGTQSDFGKEIDWPARGKVNTPAESADLAKLRRAGVTEKWASEQAKIYREIATKNPKNPSAALRADWLEKIAERLRNEP